MRRLALAILLLAAPAFAQEPTKFTLQIASSSGGAGNVLGPGAPCTDDTVPTFDGATATQLQCSTLLYSADGDLTATRGVQGKWGLFQPTTDTTSLIARRQAAGQTSYVFQIQTEANAHVLGIGPTGTVTGPAGGFGIIGGTGAGDALTLDATSNATGGPVQIPAGNTIRLYGFGSGTTDTEYLEISSTPGSGFTLTAVRNGTGAANLDIGLAPVGTGVAKASGGFTLTGGAGGFRLRHDGIAAGAAGLMIGSLGTATFYVCPTGSCTGDDAQVVSSGDVQILGASTGILFEGTADAYETKLTEADATADRTITLPDADGRVMLLSTEASTAGVGSPNVLTLGEVGKVVTNEGASAKAYNTLPTAVAGHRFVFVVQDADGLRIVANTADTVRIAAAVSSAAGYCESTTIGDAVTLIAMNDTEWMAVSVVGAGWTCA